MAYSAVELSKYIITKCARDNKPISNLQLQKILYFIQKEYLQKKGVPAFNDPIEAWRFGPVVPEAYYFFCGAGAMPITDIYDDSDISSSDKELVNKVVEEKRVIDPWTLVDQTHREGCAWDRVYQHGLGNRKRIPQNWLKDDE